METIHYLGIPADGWDGWKTGWPLSKGEGGLCNVTKAPRFLNQLNITNISEDGSSTQWENFTV